MKRFSSLLIHNRPHLTDEWTNVSNAILSKMGKDLYKIPHHPLNKIKSRVEGAFLKQFPFKILDSLDPVVTTKQNFDDLLIAKDHPGRQRSDTYYVNADHVLRTHTSAHQSMALSSGMADGYLITSDVYRRDEIDPTHYPIFHQMEGIRLFSPNVSSNKSLELGTDNPMQNCHTKEQVQMVAHDLRDSMEMMIKTLFSKDLQIRWVETYFPFTQPSWEMEIFFRDQWLEVCGCGVIRQEILNAFGCQDKIGWAFGFGLERLAMILFDIPDIRLFWSEDPRFLNQFKTSEKFVPFSKYPICYKDISFWCPPEFHENDFMEVVRAIAGDLVEQVRLIDEFTHPKTKRKSKCFRLDYRSMEKTLTNEQVDELQEQIRKQVALSCGVELRG